MSITMVKATIKSDKTAERDKAAQGMFTAIEAAHPQGVRYASCKLADGETGRVSCSGVSGFHGGFWTFAAAAGAGALLAGGDGYARVKVPRSGSSCRWRT